MHVIAFSVKLGSVAKHIACKCRSWTSQYFKFMRKEIIPSQNSQNQWKIDVSDGDMYSLYVFFKL